MTANADIVLFAYTVVLAGATTGAQMLYFGAVLRRSLRLGSVAIAPSQLRAAGTIFSVAGALAIAVMAVEVLSGAAGTDVRIFIAATLIVPPAVWIFNALRNARVQDLR